MLQVTHVLCPVDLSDASRHALEHAGALARWHEARLTVLYVYENRPNMDVPALVLSADERAALNQKLVEFTAPVTELAPVLRVEDAPFVHEAVLADISSLGADLLVIGTHGRSGFDRLFFGSVAEKLLRKAPCPTLIVPGRAPGVDVHAPVRYERILCAVDFSDASLDALAQALTLAEEADAALTLLHVVEVPAHFGEDGLTPDLDSRHVKTVVEADARQRLQRLVPEEARTYCTIDTVVSNGRAHREVLAEAAKRNVSLIVMGVHGRGAVGRLVFGSTTERVVREATCPVLVVRRP